MSKKISYFLMVVLFCATFSKKALGFDVTLSSSTSLLQTEFKELSEELSRALNASVSGPAEPLGILGFDVGVDVTTFAIDDNASRWTKVAGDPPHLLILPKLHAQKGLPFGVDLSATYTKIPSSNISMVGGGIKWAVVSGNAVLPAIAVRGSYEKLLGISDWNLSTYGVDLSASKGFALVTPYIGVGQIWTKSTATVAALTPESFGATKAFAGLKVSLLLLSFVGEVSVIQGKPLYSGRMGVGF